MADQGIEQEPGHRDRVFCFSRLSDRAVCSSIAAPSNGSYAYGRDSSGDGGAEAGRCLDAPAALTPASTEQSVIGNGRTKTNQDTRRRKKVRLHST
jgi:hypothetical protein